MNKRLPISVDLEMLNPVKFPQTGKAEPAEKHLACQAFFDISELQKYLRFFPINEAFLPSNLDQRFGSKGFFAICFLRK